MVWLLINFSCDITFKSAYCKLYKSHAAARSENPFPDQVTVEMIRHMKDAVWGESIYEN